jgi:hypothetical protein
VTYTEERVVVAGKGEEDGEKEARTLRTTSDSASLRIPGKKSSEEGGYVA